MSVSSISFATPTPFASYPAAAPTSNPAIPPELTPQEQAQVDQLERRDAEVREHEQAHLRAAGPYGQGPPVYEYQQGPDGERYAIGGYVGIDTSKIAGDPEATLQKAQVVKRAALAPKEPSTQDRKIAAEADQMAAEAKREIQEQKNEAAEATPGTSAAGPSALVAALGLTAQAAGLGQQVDRPSAMRDRTAPLGQVVDVYA
ncbi:MAG: hypothetical protein RhofKO_13300 [Rhodothermales bacterium]